MYSNANNFLLEIVGKIEFEPVSVTRKHASQSSWKHVAMIRTECDLYAYYGWFIKKRFNLELNKPIRGTHVTFISDRIPNLLRFERAKEMFDGKEIKFYIDIEPRSNGEHWWLRAFSPDTESIREIVGLSKEPYFSLHMTIGHSNEKNRAHSEYILEQCKRFELISNEPRKKFNEYKIL